MSILDDELEDLEEDLEDSKDATGSSAGPLSEPEQSQVAGKLSNSESIISRILDPNRSPSLDPTDAGSVDTSVSPTTLPEHAQECHTLAKKAHSESQNQNPDHELIGTNIKTIKHLIPEYRNLAGIT